MSLFGETDDRPIADATVFVHDEVLNIDRRIVAGQPVPNDLRAAYAAATGGKPKAARKTSKSVKDEPPETEQPASEEK